MVATQPDREVWVAREQVSNPESLLQWLVKRLRSEGQAQRILEELEEVVGHCRWSRFRVVRIAMPAEEGEGSRFRWSLEARIEEIEGESVCFTVLQTSFAMLGPGEDATRDEWLLLGESDGGSRRLLARVGKGDAPDRDLGSYSTSELGALWRSVESAPRGEG